MQGTIANTALTLEAQPHRITRGRSTRSVHPPHRVGTGTYLGLWGEHWMVVHLRPRHAAPARQQCVSCASTRLDSLGGTLRPESRGKRTETLGSSLAADRCQISHFKHPMRQGGCMARLHGPHELSRR